MKELSEIVTEKIGTMIDDGTIETLLSERLEKTVGESIDRALQSYGEFGKAITEKIEESVQCAARDVQFPAYNQFIKTVVVQKFSELIEANAAAHLADILETALPPVTKEEKFSTVQRRIEAAWLDIARENQRDEISISSEENDKGTSLVVTLTSPEYEEKTKVTFYNFRGEGWHIGYIWHGGKAITGSPIRQAATHMDQIALMFFQYYAMQTVFEADEEFYSISTDY